MTPTRKGLYSDCNTCLLNKTNSNTKYPCILSHKDIRQHSGSLLERNFQACGIHQEREEITEEEPLPFLQKNTLF